MRPFTALLDAPADPSTPIQIATIGDYSDSRYGDFSITTSEVEDWKKNLSALPGGEALIDFEHRSERKPRDSRAAGWITGIELDGDKVMATPRWTAAGEKEIRDGTYRFVSPAYGTHTNEQGVTFENTLMSLALTNKPALTGLPAVVLASEERVSEAAAEQIARLLDIAGDDLELDVDDIGRAKLTMLSVTAADRKKAKKAGNSLDDGSYPINNVEQLHSAAVLSASKHGNWAAKALVRRRAKDMGVSLTHLPGMTKSADSRQHEMPDAALLKLLDLPEDADEATVLSAAEALKTKADTPAPNPEAAKPSKKELRKLLEQEADAGGLVLLTRPLRELQQGAADGALARHELHEQKFATKFAEAVKDRKATPAEEDSLKELYAAAPDATLKLLDAREAVTPVPPTTPPSIEFDPDSPETFDPETAAAAGFDPNSIQLDAQIQKHLRDHNLPQSDYATVLDQALSGQVRL